MASVSESAKVSRGSLSSKYLARDEASAERVPAGSAAAVWSLASDATVVAGDAFSAGALRSSRLGGDLEGDLQ